MKKSRILCLVLALVMCLSLVACGGNNDDTSGNDGTNPPDTSKDTSTDTSTEPQGPEDDGTLMADTHHQADFDQVAFDAAADEIYDEVLGDFYDAYQKAIAETENVDLRTALMAVAEAKMLESGVFGPGNVNSGGNYSISKIIPHTAPTVAWGFDGDTGGRAIKSVLIVDQILTPDQRNMLSAKWKELEGTGTWDAWVRQWIADNGYTVADSLTTGYSGEPSTWDALASYQSTVGQPVSMLMDTLLTYDTENVQHPALAESYDVSEDGLTYTFHLRQGMKWVTYQGTEIGEIKADDFVAGMQHAADASPTLASVLFGTLTNLEEYCYGEVTDFAQVGVKALDDYTVQYTLAVPAPWFPTLTGYSLLYPMSRSYYESQGGKFGQEFNSESDTYLYGTDPQHIAYCGPYLVSNYTYNNRFVFVANPSYRDAENVTLKTITWLYDDGTDPTRNWTFFMDGTYNGSISLSAENLVQAQQTKVPDDPDGKTYFEKYSVVSAADKSSMMSAFNLNRYAYANYNDETRMVSAQTASVAARTHAALMNQNFRLALTLGLDRGAYGAIGRSEELKYTRLINTYTPGDLVSLTNDTTVDINGTATTFKAGTYYGEIVQAQITADGYPMKVWDETLNDGLGSSAGFDGWYNPEKAAEYMDKAIEELAAEGVVIDKDNPIQLDMAYGSFYTLWNQQHNALKQLIEGAFDGLVVVNLIDCVDQDGYYNATYYGNTGYTMNYDYMYGASGWSPDYGSPQTYLDTMKPGSGGSMTIMAGLG